MYGVKQTNCAWNPGGFLCGPVLTFNVVTTSFQTERDKVIVRDYRVYKVVLSYCRNLRCLICCRNRRFRVRRIDNPGSTRFRLGFRILLEFQAPESKINEIFFCTGLKLISQDEMDLWIPQKIYPISKLHETVLGIIWVVLHPSLHF